MSETLAGKYRVVRYLGSGGTGVVYLAEHLYLRRLTALKVLHPHLCARDPGAEELFRRGALLAARIDHPHVARIYDFERAPDGSFLLAMEYVDGETLDQRLRRLGPAPIGETLRLAGAVAEGLDHAHGLGILHRDLKPENVMLGAGGAVKILDFGIALEARCPVPPDGALWGTPAYMSPEQLLGEPLGPASDVYALGVLVYEALTGLLPHTGATPAELAARRLTQPPAPVHARCPDVPPELADAVARALDPDPATRWPSAGAFVRAASHARTHAATAAQLAAWQEYCLPERTA